MDYNTLMKEILNDKIRLCTEIRDSQPMINNCSLAAEMLLSCYRHGGKVLFCGNGGSAADAQHLAAELSGRFYYDRMPLNAEALHVNTSYLTAVANDRSFDEVYSRQVEAKGRPGDILVTLSTSGNSKNIINAAKKASGNGIKVISLTGKGGGKLKDLSDLNIDIPSDDTPRIQEMHITLGHFICQVVEKNLFPDAG